MWLKNGNGGPMMTGDSSFTRREVAFTVTAVRDSAYGVRYLLDTHNSEARRRYCGTPMGYSADSLITPEA